MMIVGLWTVIMYPETLTPEEACRDPNQVWEYLLGLFQKHPEVYESRDAHDQFIESLPRGLEITYWLVTVDGEIQNGGIRQLFWNHSAWEIDRAIRALDEMEAVETAQNLRTAVQIFETINVPETRMAYWQDDKGFHAEPTLNAIDEARCTDEASRRDWQRLTAYIAAHPEQFRHG